MVQYYALLYVEVISCLVGIMWDSQSFVGGVRRTLRLDVFKDVARQYPFIFCIFTVMISSTIILNQWVLYKHTLHMALFVFVVCRSNVSKILQCIKMLKHYPLFIGFFCKVYFSTVPLILLFMHLIIYSTRQNNN